MISIGQDACLIVRKEPQSNPNPKGIGSSQSNHGAKSVAAGLEHTFVITGDSKVWACGRNLYGELGTGSASSDQDYFIEVLTSHAVDRILGGEFYTLFTDSTGSLWGVGSAENGQLGLDDPLDTPFSYATPQKIVDRDGVAAWDGYAVTAFSASLDYTHSLFVAGGSLWGTGSNTIGVIGISQDDDDDDIYTAYRNVGNNGSNRAAHPIKVFETSKPYAIGASATVIVPVVEDATPATLDDVPSDNETDFDDAGYNLSVTITGSNKGNLGYSGGGANPDGTADVVFSGTASGTGTVTVTINQYIRTTATSLDGDVGLVASSESHTIFTSADGKSAWCCGVNNNGECGTGSQVAGDHEGEPVGSGPNQNSEDTSSSDGEPTCFQPVAVVLPSMAGRTITQVATGDSHTLILMSDGSLWGMGNNDSGQLGVPDPVDGVDGWVVDGPTNEVHKPFEIISSEVSFIAAASNSSFAVKSDGTLLGWGKNSRSPSYVGGGQLGNARYITDVTVSTDTPNYPIVLSTYPVPHDLLDGSQPYIRDCMNQADQRAGSTTAPGDRLRPITGIDPYSFSLNGAYIEEAPGSDATCQAWYSTDSPCTEPLSEFPANRTTIDEPYARVYLSSSDTAYACRYPQVIPIEGIAWNTKTPYGDNAPAVDEGSTAGFMPPVGSNNRVPIESPAPIATSTEHSIFITTLETRARWRPSPTRDYIWSMGDDDDGRLGQISPDGAAIAGVYNASNVGNPYNFPYYGQAYNDAGGIRKDFPNQIWVSENGI